MLFALNSVHFV